MDEDGILLDANERFANYPLRRSDSGFGTVERKSSSSAASRHRSIRDFEDQFNVAGGFEGYREDSYPVEERSLNISDLEASDSRSGGTSPFDRRSLDSSIDLDYDEDLNIRRPRRRHRFSSGDDYLPSDAPKTNKAVRESKVTGSQHGADFNFNRLHEHSKDLRNFDHSSSSLFQSGEFTPSRDRSRDEGYNHDDRYHDNHSGNQSNSKDYLLQDRKRERQEDEVERDSLDEVDPVTGVSEGEDSVFHRSVASKGRSLPGESIFTQDEVVPDGGGHSLLEFEQLEAAVVDPDGEDLIGAYLKDLSNRNDEDDDDTAHTDDNDVITDTDLIYKNSSSEEERRQTTSRQISRSEAVDIFGNEDDFKRKDNYVGAVSAFEEESLSLIENQQPPFITSLLSLDNNEGSGHDTSKDTSVVKPSKIPYLRSRSPSMSRPGSAEPRSRNSSRPGSGSHSPVGSRSRPRSKNRSRTLPHTPHKGESAVSNSRSRSRSSSAGSQLSVNRSSSIPGKSSRQITSSQEERDLDQATLLLADDAEVASLTSTGESNKKINKHNRPRPASAGSRIKPPVSRSKSEATINLNRPSSAKQAKNVSSSRSNTPKSFRVRSQSTTALVPTKQPLKASHSMAGRIVQEGEEHERKLNEETLTQLQQDYTKLLKKYAEAENTIDSLRIGAKIPISIEVAGNGALGPGQPSPGGTSVRRGSNVSTAGGLVSAPQGKLIAFNVNLWKYFI